MPKNGTVLPFDDRNVEAIEVYERHVVRTPTGFVSAEQHRHGIAAVVDHVRRTQQSKDDIEWCVEPEDWKALNYLYAVASLCAEVTHDGNPIDAEMVKRGGRVVRGLFAEPKPTIQAFDMLVVYRVVHPDRGMLKGSLTTGVYARKEDAEACVARAGYNGAYVIEEQVHWNDDERISP